MELKVGNKVKVIGNKYNSINEINDIGTINKITESDPDGLNYKVYVPGREYNGTKNISNWHTMKEIEVIED